MLRETLVPLESERPELRETEETQETVECLAEVVTEETPEKMVLPETPEQAELRETLVFPETPDVMDNPVELELREILVLSLDLLDLQEHPVRALQEPVEPREMLVAPVCLDDLVPREKR